MRKRGFSSSGEPELVSLNLHLIIPVTTISGTMKTVFCNSSYTR